MINKNYENVGESYLFSTIARKVNEYCEKNKDAEVIRMGIGDVTKPLCPSVIKALHDAVDEMAEKETFKGYGPEQGYSFLKESISEYYKKFGVELGEKEIFISDGAKSDLGNILDIFSNDCKVLIINPVYPVYCDTNIMAGREIILSEANEENGFLPMPDENIKVDLIYLCSPNNPTGAAYNRDQLKKWVDYANNTGAVILFDAAYEAFIVEDSIPHSIYEIDGSDTCAIEFCSLSKTAGFTGTRCGYTIVPERLERDGSKLNFMWLRRQTTKMNGVPYIVQKGAAAVFTEQGQKEIKENIDYYRKNAQVIMETLDRCNVFYTGGKNSPYVWMKCPKGMSSWEFFDYLIEEANVVGTPGEGFGSCGENYFRLTAFSTYDNTIKAMKRLEDKLC